MNMKVKELLKQVLYMGNTEAQGIAVSGLFQTQSEFVKHWFGDTEIIGGFNNNADYLYSYDEALEGVPDMVLIGDDFKVYLYEIED